MLTGTFNLGSDESRSDTWNSQRQTRTATFFAFTDMRLSKIGVEFCSYGTYETAVTIGVSVDGVSVFSEEIPMPLGETHEFTYFYVDTNISVGLGQTVTISGTTGANGTGVYHGTAGSMLYPWGQMTGSDNLAVEMTAEYAPIWLVDGQNDGYPRIVGYDAVEFTEFEKDADGYPLNWGVWKLDNNNEGYPWPTGFIPAHGGGNVLVFGENGLIPASVLVFGESGLLPAQVVTYT